MPSSGQGESARRTPAEWLREIGRTRDRKARAAAFGELARELTERRLVESFLRRTFGLGRNGRRFVMEIASRLPLPLAPAVIDLITPLFRRTGIPARLRIVTVVHVLKSLPDDPLRTNHVLDELTSRVSPFIVAERLKRVHQLLPHHAEIARRRAAVEIRSIVPCPICAESFPNSDLVNHLWSRHRMLWEDGRAVEPWTIVRKWIGEYVVSKRGELLDRACELAQGLDADHGLKRVYRLVRQSRRNGEDPAIDDDEVVPADTSICPHCCYPFRFAADAVPQAVTIGANRVWSDRYSMDLNEDRWLTRLTIQTPEQLLYQGTEPGRILTRRGAVILLLTPMIVAAWLFALMPPLFGFPVIVPVSAVVITLIFTYLGIRLQWERSEASRDTAADAAWVFLAPRLIHLGLSDSDECFLAGLAESSRGTGRPADREKTVRRLLDLWRPDRVPHSLLPPLYALQLSDLRDDGEDYIAEQAERIGDVFIRRIPFIQIEETLRRIRLTAGDVTERARLRILTLARAFDAGLEPADLHDLGHVYPSIGESYAGEDRNGLARLRLLWLYRPRRLWSKVGAATAAFDLARYPTLAALYLRQRPDLLLFQPTAGTEVENAPILICEEGVVYRDSVVKSADLPMAVRARSVFSGGGFELTVGDDVYAFRSDPRQIAARLKAWSRFLFEEFLPAAYLLRERRAGTFDSELQNLPTRCPQCRGSFAPIRGSTGIAALAVVSDDE